MFWLVPLGLEGDELWPPPWFTLAALLLCCAVHVRANWVDSEIATLLARAPACEETSSAVRLWGDDVCALTKRRFDQLVTERPVRQLSFRPSEPRVHQALSSLFVHGDLAHLLFNLVFLWTFGGALERRIGALQTAVVFLAGGVLAAYLGTTDVPLVGASGAIAALMGAMCIEAAGESLRLGYAVWVVFIVRAGTVSLRVAWVLSAWAGLQWLLHDRQAAHGVAYGVHLAGFVLGLAYALARKMWMARARAALR